MDNQMLQQILKALEIHGAKIDQKLDLMKEQIDERFEQVDKRFEQVDKRFEQVDKRFEQVDKRFEQLEQRFDRLEKKFDGHKVELLETQETVDYLASKNLQHERKLRKLSELQASST